MSAALTHSRLLHSQLHSRVTRVLATQAGCDLLASADNDLLLSVSWHNHVLGHLVMRMHGDESHVSDAPSCVSFSLCVLTFSLVQCDEIHTAVGTVCADCDLYYELAWKLIGRAAQTRVAEMYSAAKEDWGAENKHMTRNWFKVRPTDHSIACVCSTSV